jgi:hypothetical protein
MLAALGTIAPLAKMLFSTVDKAIPDKDLAEKLKAQLNTQLIQSSTEELKAAASIVEAEMIKKIKNKICEIICKIFKIKPCVCGHECNCKKENK